MEFGEVLLECIPPQKKKKKNLINYYFTMVILYLEEYHIHLTYSC